MVYCQQCGYDLDETSKFCPECGTQQKPVASKGSSGKTDPVSQSDQTATKSSPKAFNQYSVEGAPSQQQPSIKRKVPQRSYAKYGGLLLLSVIFGVVSVVFVILRLLDFGGGIHSPIRLFAFPFIAVIVAATSSLVYIYYIYQNFEDYRLLHFKTHGNTYPTPQEPIWMIIAFFLFSPITYYFKYDQLYQHIRNYHDSDTKLPPSPIMILAAIVGPGFIVPVVIIPIFILGTPFLGILLAGVLAILSFLFFLYLENSWQEAFNRHVNFHQA